MSLVPYSSREGREIVLRHQETLVVRDPSSLSLEIRSTECPTCHRPLPPSSPGQRFEDPVHGESYVDPDYFRMLRDRHIISQEDHALRNPPSPIRRLARPILSQDNISSGSVANAGFTSSGLTPHERNRIRRDAFSPNYFGTFFVEEKELGRGGKGVVLLVRHEIDGCHLGHFACKRVPVGDDHAWLEKVLVEVELLAKLSHPNLVSYRHVWLENVRLNRFGPTVACAFILQQFCNNGDLLHYIIGDSAKETTKEELKAQMRRRSRGQSERPKNLHRWLTFEEIYSLFKDITSGLAYLHSMGYIHRDLKPGNCLLHREGGKLVCLISDFGEVQHEDAARKSTGSTGTISWCSPEVLRADEAGRYGDFTTKSDIFSLGMILYFLCFGRLPYASANAVNEELEDVDLLRDEITGWKGFNDERRERPDLPPKLYQLLKSLLDLDPLKRPGAAEVLSAIKGESILEGGSRMPRSPSPSSNMGGHRIQNLDSPLPSGTPIPVDPTKGPPRRPSLGPSGQVVTGGSVAAGEHGEPSFIRQASPTGPRHRASASRGRDRYSDIPHGLTSPSPRPADSHEQQLPDTPLLMAPPTSAGVIPEARTGWWYRLNQQLPISELLAVSAWIGLFLMKMVALAKPCLPFMFNLSAGLPLTVLAALDLGVAITRRAGRASGLLAINRAHAEHHTLDWSPRTSLSLLGLHFLSIWGLTRFELLCRPPPDEWLAW
ncbi:related to human P1/eIF-2a protein kinase [Cephalotrichum gorgonifer]|uniref:non-specific serine/threonine protein kinase n=1 Tax=Cephalotrichum gorgonifer TaxID=2041049 RepID=A0AAE8N7I7_9PEZI|nr:related to human P1/eIF-2a protein kinase [Cephalotrichum gorgonifer]